MLLIELLFAESEGFKPPIPERGIPDFESSAIDHSANSPNKRPSLKSDAKVKRKNELTKFFPEKERIFLETNSSNYN